MTVYKKIILISSLLVILLYSYVMAGDIPESIMMGNQKALFIGEIISLGEDSSEIKPLTIMMGSIESEILTVTTVNKSGIIKYYGTNEKPKVGDLVVIVLITDNIIDEHWIFKATTDNYETLKLVSDRNNMVKRYEEYINTGAYFEAQEKLDLQNSTSSEEDNDETDLTAEEPKDVLVTNQNNKAKGDVKLVSIGIGIIGVILLNRSAKNKR